MEENDNAIFFHSPLQIRMQMIENKICFPVILLILFARLYYIFSSKGMKSINLHICIKTICILQCSGIVLRVMHYYLSVLSSFSFFFSYLHEFKSVYVWMFCFVVRCCIRVLFIYFLFFFFTGFLSSCTNLFILCSILTLDELFGNNISPSNTFFLC